MRMKEQWGDVEGLSRYSVSNLGRVMNKTTKRVLNPIATPSGTLMLTLQTDWNKQSGFAVKWLVWRAFNDEHVPPRRIRNIDGDKTNVALSNLTVAAN